MAIFVSSLVFLGMFYSVKEIGNIWVRADLSERTNEWIVFGIIIFFLVGIGLEIRYLLS